MSDHIKSVLVRILSLFWRTLKSLGKTLAFLFFIVFHRPLQIIWKILFRFILLRVYKIYLPLRKLILERVFISRNRFLYVFTHRYIIHVFVIVITFFMAASNIRAEEVRVEEIGKDSFLPVLAHTENELLVETAESHPTSSSVSYIGSQGNVRSVIPKIGDVDSDAVATSEGGSALVKPNIATTTIGERPREDVVYHIVQGGETISTIAEEYGMKSSTILWENKLDENDIIQPGQKLTVLPQNGVSHQVKAGDTIQGIAEKYKADVDKLVEYNQLASADAITEGQILIIPDGVAPPPPPPPRSEAAPTRLAAVRDFFSNDPPPAAASSGRGFQWPTTTRRISQYFRYGHTGLDIDGEFNDSIYAADSGVIIESGWNGGYGLNVVINHGGGITTRYAHLNTSYVSVGQSVSKGASIGLEGSTGRSTGSHLHFEVRVNGAPQNPFAYY